VVEASGFRVGRQGQWGWRLISGNFEFAWSLFFCNHIIHVLQKTILVRSELLGLIGESSAHCPVRNLIAKMIQMDLITS
jgi:hypothetical protein